MIKTAIVGYGRSARVYHLPFLNFLKEYELAAFVSSNEERLSKDYPGIAVYKNVEELAQDDSINLAVITSPVFAHFQQVKTLIEAKKNIVVEKPFTVTAKEAQDLVDLAQANNVKLTVYQNRRWDAGFLKIKELIKSGAVGKINHFEVHFDRWRPNTKHAWREEDYKGSGVLYELGVHFIDQVLNILGKPESIIVDMDKQREGSKIDDYYHVIFQYPKARAVIHSSSLSRLSPPHILLEGEKLSLIQEELDAQEQLLIKEVEVGSNEWQEKNFNELLINAGSSLEEVEKIQASGSYQEFYELMADSIINDKPVPVDPQEIVAVMETIEEICSEKILL